MIITPSSNSRLHRHLGYAVVIMAIAVLAGYKGVLPVLRSHLMDYLAIGDAGFGLLFSIGGVTGLFGVLFGGMLIDRWGPRRVIRLCLFGIGSAMFIVAFGGNHFAAFLLATAVSGLFAAPFAIAVTAYVGRLFPRHQRRVISLKMASSSIGGMLFPLVAEGLLALSSRSALTFAQVLHLPFLLAGGLLFAASALYLPRMAPPVQTALPRAQGAPWQWRDLRLPAPLLTLAVLLAVHGMADACLYLWMARFLESSSFTAPVVSPGVVLAGYALAYLLSRGLLASLPDHVGRRAFLVLPGLLGGSLMLAGILSRDYLLTAGGYLLGAFCFSFEYPAMVSRVMGLEGRRFGAVMAVAGVLEGALIFIAMNGMGLLIARLGDARIWQVMLIPALAFVCVGAGGLYWLRRFDGARPAAPALGRSDERAMPTQGDSRL